MRIVDGGQKSTFCSLGCSLVMFSISSLLTCFHLTPRKILLVREADVDARTVARLLRKAEREDESNRPVDLVCRASQSTVALAREVEEILENEYGDDEDALEGAACQPLASGMSRASVEGARQPRGIL